MESGDSRNIAFEKVLGPWVLLGSGDQIGRNWQINGSEFVGIRGLQILTQSHIED